MYAGVGQGGVTGLEMWVRRGSRACTGLGEEWRGGEEGKKGRKEEATRRDSVLTFSSCFFDSPLSPLLPPSSFCCLFTR